jgi:hypothetical protein
VSITSLTRSCGLRYKGNRVLGAVRFLGTVPRSEREETSLDGEGVSPNASEPDSASLRYFLVANLPERAKPTTRTEERSTNRCGARRGGWGGRVPKERSRNLGGPMRSQEPTQGERGVALWFGVVACDEKGVSDSALVPHLEPRWERQRRRGNHNPSRVRSRESERLIVARKWGNSHGAKGPYFSHVFNKERRAA